MTFDQFRTLIALGAVLYGTHDALGTGWALIILGLLLLALPSSKTQGGGR